MYRKGSSLQVLILLPGIIGSGTRYAPAWDLAGRRPREVGRLLLPNGLAVGVGYAGFNVDTAFASRADDPASLPAIHNAFLLVGLPIALLGQAVGQAAFPRLAAHAAAGEYHRLRSTLLRTLAAVLVLSLGAITGLIVLGRPTIRILFEHGEFTAHDGDLTFRVLAIYALGLPAYVATELLVRALIAMRSPQTQLYTNTAQLLVRAALVVLPLGALQTRATPLAFVVAAVLETCALVVITLGRPLRDRSVAAALLCLAATHHLGVRREPAQRERYLLPVLPCARLAAPGRVPGMVSSLHYIQRRVSAVVRPALGKVGERVCRSGVLPCDQRLRRGVLRSTPTIAWARPASSMKTTEWNSSREKSSR